MTNTMKNYWYRAAVCMLFTASGTSQALEVDMDIDGFAHFEYGKSLDSDGFNTLGLTEEGEYRDNNILGLRLSVDSGKNLTFAAQMVAHGEDDYEPEFEWIYVNFHLTPEINVLVGRTRMPLFMYSDYLDVGYAYPWVTPPFSVYNDSPFKTLEGVTFKYATDFWLLTSELTLWAGKTEETVTVASFDADIELDDNKGIAWAVGYEWLTVRAAYFETTSSANLERIEGLPDLFALISSLEQQTGQSGVLDDLRWENDDANFSGSGVAADFGQYFFVAEATRVEADRTVAVGQTKSFYITGGVRLGDWTVSLTYADDKTDPYRDIYQGYVDKLIGQAVPGSDAANLALAAATAVEGTILQSQHNADETWSLATRWDFHPKASATVEYLDRRHGGSVYDVATNTIRWERNSPRAVRFALDLIF